MLGFLAGIPGKLKTLIDRTPSNNATLMANLDAAISTRAAASTALSTATWDATKAAKLANAAQENSPILDTPIAAGFLPAASNNWVGLSAVPWSLNERQYQLNYTTTTGSWVDLLNYTGQGLITALCLLHSLQGAATTSEIDVIIDGVTVMSYSSGSITGSGYRLIPVVGIIANVATSLYDFFPGECPLVFKSSVQIRARLTTAGGIQIYTRLRKTA